MNCTIALIPINKMNNNIGVHFLYLSFFIFVINKPIVIVTIVPIATNRKLTLGP